MKIIVTPVGTSTLTNRCDELARQLLGQYANARKKDEIPGDESRYLADYVTRRTQEISAMDTGEAKKISAELHSLLILFEQSPPESRDLVVLIPTDTFIGRITGGIIHSYLESRRIGSQLLDIPGLQTKSSTDLRFAFTSLLREITTLKEMYGPQGARIIFNLTGGFKAVQGFLQTLSSIYADETVYIFEHESELMRIPRLPFKLQPEEYITANLSLWRRLDLCLRVGADHVAKIPDAFYYPCNGEFGLSEYGELVWQNLRPDIYAREMHPPPSNRVVFGPNYLKSVAALSGDRLAMLNRQVDELARYLETGLKEMPKSLSLKNIGKTVKPGSTHEFYAWSDAGAKRVFCHYGDDGVLVLDELGDHL